LTARFSVGLTMLLCASAWGADLHPLDVKTGQWETTMTGQMTGMPAIPPEVLNRMTPEQRAKIEAVMGGRGAKPIVNTSCITKEKLAQAWNTGQDTLKACTTKVSTSSSSKQEVHIECNRDGTKSAGTVKVEAIDAEHIRGSIEMTAVMASQGGHAMSMNYNFTSKWIGPACTEK
jgi:Protein of unknown function (DUF3617)